MEINLDALEARKAAAPKYNESETRHDPFNREMILRLIQTKNRSLLLKRSIETPADAYDHADALCLEWQKEDEIIEQEFERQQELARIENVLQDLPDLEFSVPHIKIPHGTHKQQVEFAKRQWKASVKWREELMARVTTRVAMTHDLYKSLRGVN